MIVDYTFSGVNDETLPLAPVEAMQFGHALDRILREIMTADPAYGPVNLIKVDLSDGFYRIGLNANDMPKLGLVFPTAPGEEQLVGCHPARLADGLEKQPADFLCSDRDDRRLGEPAPPTRGLAQRPAPPR